MDYAFRADRAKARGDLADAKALYARALRSERAAIRALEGVVQPSHAVLHRSAAWLALDSGDDRAAEQLAAAGLAVAPPDQIAEELRDVFEQAGFHRHLRTRGVTLSANELQLSLTGPSVGSGLAHWPSTRERVNQSVKLMRRIAEWRADRPFRAKGAPAKEVQDLMMPLVSVPRAACYAVTLAFGTTGQFDAVGLFGLPEVEDVLEDFLDILDMVDRDEMDELSRKIPDDEYRTDAVHLTRELAPDGKHVRRVGFTVRRGDDDRSVGLTTLRRDLATTGGPQPVSDDEELINVSGLLLHADALSAKNKIKIVDEEDNTHVVSVPPEMMDNIVRPKWNLPVVLSCRKRGTRLELHEIDERLVSRSD